RDSMARIDKCQVSRQSRIPLLSGVAAGRPVSLEELRYFSPVGEEYRLKSASSNSLKTLRPISSSSRAEEGKADAVAAAGVVLVNKIILLISTTPSARAKVASQLSFPAQPPLLG